MKKTIFIGVSIVLLLACILSFSSCFPGETSDVTFMVDGKMYSKISTEGNRILPLPPEPQKEGYTFLGWFYDDGIWLEPYDNSAWENQPLEKNITLYAKWKLEGVCEVHAFGEFRIIKESTCKEQGVKQAVCTECDEVISEYIPLIDHTPDSPTSENIIDSTCQTPGSYDEVVYCERCHAELERTSMEIAKKEHIAKTPVWENITDSTCEEEGFYQLVVYCLTCGEELSCEDCIIEKKPHSQEKNVCDLCGVDFLVYEYSEELDTYVVTGAQANTYETIVIPPTYQGAEGTKKVVRIAEGAFRDFANLKKVEISFNITMICENAFLGCTSLEKATYSGKKAEWNRIDFTAGNEALSGLSDIYFSNNFTEWMPL